MKTESFTKKYLAKPLAVGTTLAMLYSPFAVKNANADSYLIMSRDRNESKVGAMFSFPISFPGEGKATNYNSRNKNLEAQVVGLASAPKISGETSQAYFEKHDGNWFTKPAKEVAHGFTSVAHPYNTKTDGTKRWVPGVSTLTREGSVFAPVTGLVAYAVNGISKLFGGDDVMYNAWEENGWRTAGTFTAEVLAGIAIANSGGSRSSNGRSSNNNNTSTPADDTSTPAEEPVVSDSDEDGGDVLGPGGSGE